MQENTLPCQSGNRTKIHSYTACNLSAPHNHSQPLPGKTLHMNNTNRLRVCVRWEVTNCTSMTLLTFPPTFTSLLTERN